MSQKADKNWDRVWSREVEMDCRVAMQYLAECFNKWRRAIVQERYPEIAIIENEIEELFEREENIENQIKEDKEEQLKKLKAELDYAKFRCTL